MKAILMALKAGNTRTASADLAGIDYSTFRAWIVGYPEFSEAVKKAEADAEAAMVKAVRRAAPESWQAAAWWLERKKPEDWGKRDKVTLVQQVAEEVKNLTDDDLLAVLGYGDAEEAGTGGS